MGKKRIVHNIDVSECRNKYICRLEETTEYCERNPNCYFKQLQRKTTECNEYKQALDEIKKCIDELDWTMLEYTYKRINDIITKAKDGNE